MSEITKTAVYIVVAAAVGLTAILVRPREEDISVDALVNKPLFPEFKEPNQAASLKITVFDEELSNARKFEVAKKPGTDLWVLPSSEDYPADAAEQVRDAALAFVDLKALGVASEVADDHSTYGVVEPSENSAANSAKGVGKHVVVRNRDNKEIANLIIGKEVKDSPGMRFVRKPTQDIVYVAQIDPNKFSTSFHDWIDTDLLQVNPFDITEIGIKDYSIVQTTQRPVLKQRLDVELDFDETTGQWELDEMIVFEQGKPKPAELGPEEELDTARLNEMRNAFRDLEIVDVHRKPDGLGADLKADASFVNDAESVQSLMEKGFYPQPASGAGGHEVLAENGEVILGTKDGVQYVLRFGRISATQESAKEGKLNRSLFVSARLDDSKFVPPPKPAALQEGGAPPAVEPTAEATASEQPTEEKPAEEKPAEEKPAEEKPAEDKPAEEKPAEEKPAEAESPECDDDPANEPPAAEQAESVTEAPAEAVPAEDQPADDQPAEEKPAEEKPAEEKPAEEKPAEEKPAEEKPAEEKPAEDKPADEEAAAPAKQPSKTELEFERARIQKEYQRELDQYQERLNQARVKVAEANGRFADWYYVIPEDVYEKIHLGRKDIVKKKGEESEPTAGPGGLPGASPLPFNVPGN